MATKLNTCAQYSTDKQVYNKLTHLKTDSFFEIWYEIQKSKNGRKKLLKSEIK